MTPLRLKTFTETEPYVGYAYAYPHKTAYRALDPPVALRDAWSAERKDALSLYLHVPFCEMRCGFCNLFTTVNPDGDLTRAWLGALERQSSRVREALGDARFARLALGGGTPTWISTDALAALFAIVDRFGVDLAQTPTSVETSPRTADEAKLGLLAERGVARVSLGVQSFVETETAAAGRAQKLAWVTAALDRIRAAGFRTLNIDLMYGLAGQTVATWIESLRMALRWRPEELYLYPLYVRPLTGLGRHGASAEDDLRLACYRAGRELLLAEGYAQRSMRMFRAPWAPAQDGPVYCCQDDGMVGLGCGARSYTRALHYSSEWAVGARGVREILADYVARPEASFDRIDHGCWLDDEEQRRRWLIKSLLQAEGVDLAAWRARFASDLGDDLPELDALAADGLTTRDGDSLRLTPAGLERSDAIGPWLYSGRAVERMRAYDLR
jgi:oxygen-independent coproporphyrinogen-3 oxidase